MKNGTLMVLSFGQDGRARKVFELKITNRFPMIAINSDDNILVADGEEQIISGYQHLSIPPSLQLHMTSNTAAKPKIWFDSDLVDRKNGLLRGDVTRIFYWISGQISSYKEPKDSSKPRYHQAQIALLTPDEHFTAQTGVCVEFFVHSAQNAEAIKNWPSLANSRINENLIGPYEFQQIVRSEKDIEPKYFFTIRVGFHEAEDEYSRLMLPFATRPPR